MKVFDSELLSYMTFFESSLGIPTEYCAKYNNSLIFIVKPWLLKTARKRENIQKLSRLLKKKVRVVASNPNIEAFTKEIVQITFKKLIRKGEEVTIYASPQSRGLLIGRNAERKKELLNILGAFFDIKELKILRG